MKNNQIQRAYWALLHKIDEDVNYYFYELFREITMLPKSLQDEYLNNFRYFPAWYDDLYTYNRNRWNNNTYINEQYRGCKISE